MELDYRTLDVFTDTPFAGNPLAVFPRARGLDTGQMQRVALEMNLSESVFVFPPETPEGTRRIRIFTPGREVPFAGHPTVGTAFYLVASGEVELPRDGGTLVLEENVGPVRVRVDCRDGVPVSAELTAADERFEAPVEAPRDVLGALVSVPEEAVGAEGVVPGVTGRLEPAFASVGLPYLILPLRDIDAVESAVLDTAVWRELLPPGAPSRMVYLVAPGGRGAGVDLHVRMFAPDAGVPEDPATGSAAAALGAYLGTRATDGDHAWTLEQGLEMGRPSRLSLRIEAEGGEAVVVRVGGPSVLMSRGSMPSPPRTVVD
ncbi:MAG: PhzF family phenazine biosynthesis protein [Gemmatimonadota bacterium]